MKRIFILLTFILITSFTFAQQQKVFSVRGGYSYMTGVVGAEFMFKRFGFGAGWTPKQLQFYDKTKDKDSFCVSASFYSDGLEDNSVYGSIGYNSYIFEPTDKKTYGNGTFIVGYRIVQDYLNAKIGLGGGFNSHQIALIWEITLGVDLLYFKK